MTLCRCLVQVSDDDGLHQPGDVIEIAPESGLDRLLADGSVELVEPDADASGEPEAEVETNNGKTPRGRRRKKG